MEETIWLVLQDGLKVLGGGAAAIVYEVNENIVLKASRIYQTPAGGASRRDWWAYADSTLFSLQLAQQEKGILRLLESQPHHNIAEAITIDEDDGIYLRRYLPLSHVERPQQPGRVSWYQDLLRGLARLHSLGICHSDLWPDNVLCSQGPVPMPFSATSAWPPPSAS